MNSDTKFLAQLIILVTAGISGMLTLSLILTLSEIRGKEKQKVEYTLELINQTDVSIKPVNNTQADTIPFEDIEEYILRDNL